jgi:hypothetical protein
MVVANNVRCCCVLREIARRGNLSYTERHPVVVDVVELGGVTSAAVFDMLQLSNYDRVRV